MSDHLQREIAFLGIETSPAFVRASEDNGCTERLIQTLRENLLWVGHFETIAELVMRCWRSVALRQHGVADREAQLHQPGRIPTEPTSRYETSGIGFNPVSADASGKRDHIERPMGKL
jgi:hypothetical protein